MPPPREPREGSPDGEGDTDLTNPIITLTTDYGTNDHLVGVLKGVILKINPEATIIDVTHGIKIEAFNIKSDEIKKDKETEVRFTPLQTGHFEAKCSHFCGKGHGTMKLQIDVVP